MRVPKPDRLSNELSQWWRYLSVKQASGYVAALVGVVLTIVTAVITGPPQLLIAVIAVVAQGWAAFAFAGSGKAHPTLAKSAFGRLVALAEKVRVVEGGAQAAFEKTNMTADERHTKLGILSTELSWIGEGIYDAAQDWIAFNEHLLDMIDETQRKEIMRAVDEAKRAVGNQADPPKAI